MKKVWITTDVDLIEDRESCENNKDVIKKTVFLEAGVDSKVYSTFEQNNAENKMNC